MPATEELSQQEAEQMSDVAVEEPAADAEVAAAPEAEAEAATPDLAAQDAAAQETADPDLLAKQAEEQKTASEQAYGHDAEMTPEDRKALLQAASTRIEAALAPFTLAVSNRREELRARANNAKLIGSLGQIGFGDAMPGVVKGNAGSGLGMPQGAAKKVSHAALKSSHMKKNIAKVNKIPMLNFNLNYPKFVGSETSEEFVDILSASAATANEALRVGLDDYSDDVLASLCAAFDPKMSTCSVFEDHIDSMLAKMEVDTKGEEEEELEDKVAEKQADAAADDPEEKQKLAQLDAERAKEGGEQGEKRANEQIAERETKIAESKGQDKQSVLEQVPDEMRDLYDNRAYSQV